MSRPSPPWRATPAGRTSRTGIAYFGSASGTARNNLCTANGLHGIEVNEQAQPTLEGNTCRENEWSGIAYFGNAGGVARNNECIGNGKDGIYVDSTACPMLRDNRCQGNKGKKVNDRRRWFRRRWC
jgi:parallel beta-helix repeat protein